MELGPYAATILPPPIARAFRVTTAQQLADSIDAAGTLTPAWAREVEDAYAEWRLGDSTSLRAFLRRRARISEADADAALRLLDAARVSDERATDRSASR